jgi:hypothetical protein
LSTFDGKRIAIVIIRKHIQSVLRGTARWIQLSHDGLLQIKVNQGEEPGDPVFELRESDWRGNLVLDADFGCDFQVQINVPG